MPYGNPWHLSNWGHSAFGGHVYLLSGPHSAEECGWKGWVDARAQGTTVASMENQDSTCHGEMHPKGSTGGQQCGRCCRFPPILPIHQLLCDTCPHQLHLRDLRVLPESQDWLLLAGHHHLHCGKSFVHIHLHCQCQASWCTRLDQCNDCWSGAGSRGGAKPRLPRKRVAKEIMVAGPQPLISLMRLVDNQLFEKPT